MDNNNALRGLVKHNVHWTALTTYLDEQSDTLIQQLKRCKPEDLQRLQGELRFIDKLLSLPGTLQ